MKVARQLGTQSEHGDREKDGFYATPARLTADLLEKETFSGPVWECCAGMGHMSEALLAAGNEVISTDLVDRGYDKATTRIDVLLEYQLHALNVMSNPPFKLFGEIARHLLSLKPEKLVLLGKLNALSLAGHVDLWADSRFACYYVFRYGSRPSLLKDGDDKWLEAQGMLDLCWYVWKANPTTHAELRFVGKD